MYSLALRCLIAADTSSPPSFHTRSLPAATTPFISDGDPSARRVPTAGRQMTEAAKRSLAEARQAQRMDHVWVPKVGPILLLLLAAAAAAAAAAAPPPPALKVGTGVYDVTGPVADATPHAAADATSDQLGHARQRSATRSSHRFDQSE